MKINPDKLRRDDPEVAAKKAQLEKLLALDKEAKKSGAVLEPDLTLAEFMKKFWHVIEPATELKWGWYMDAICEHLEAVTTGKLRNLIINIPPRMSKSTLVAVMWPVWSWTFQPHKRFLFSSYGANISERDSLRCKRLIRSAEYQAKYGRRYQLMKDKDTIEKFETNRGGYRIATSVDGISTGEGGDVIVCLPHDVPIETDHGPIPIGEVVEKQLSVKVLGPSGKFQDIEAYEKNPGRPLIEIETEDGNTLRCTEDHLVYTDERGWVPARDVVNLVHDDLHLRRLQQPVRKTASPYGTFKDGEILFPSMLWSVRDGFEESPLLDEDRDVRELWRDVQDWTRRIQEEDLVLSGVQVIYSEESQDARLRVMSSDVYQDLISPTVLQSPVCQQSTSDKYPRGSKRSIQGRLSDQTIRTWLYEKSTPSDMRTRQMGLCPLRSGSETSSGSSHRRFERQSQSTELSESLHFLSSSSSYESWNQCFLDESVRVRAVRCLPPPDWVYNVRVAPDHAYYAAGLLVHNCDDPLKASDGNSQTKRDYANAWWVETMPSRLNDQATGCKVVIMQRLHENDLTGFLVTMGAGYEILCLPMEYEIPRDEKGNELPKHVTCLGFSDPRTIDGELLCPERINETEIARMKSETTEYAWAGQYQQRPAPRGGGMFRVDKIETIERVPPEARLIRFRSWDRAATQGGGAYTAGVLFGFDVLTNTVYILDVHRGQWNTDNREAETMKMAREDGLNTYIVLEQEPGSAGVDSIRATTKMLIGFKVSIDKVTGDKVLRAEPFATQVSISNVKMIQDKPEKRWNQAYLKELETFPRGTYKDQVDSSSLGFNWIARMRTTPRAPVSGPVPNKFGVG